MPDDVTGCGHHLAQVCGDAIYGSDVVAAFFLGSAEPIAAIMICEPAMYSAVQQKIEAANVASSQIFFVDVGVALSHVMGPAGLDAGRASNYFDHIVDSARLATGGGVLRIYGEMGNLLCQRKQYSDALRLEGLAEFILSSEPDASILCGYSAENFDDEEGFAQFGRICGEHAHVIRAETFVARRFGKSAEEIETSLADSPASEIGEDREGGENSRDLLSAQKVYVIDDDPSVRKSVSQFLSLMGMDVLSFAAAEDFLAELPKLPAGSLVVDLQLPGMSGLELLREMAGAGIRWPAVVISGAHDGEEDAVSAVLGPDRYLRKPFDPGALLRALHRR